HPERNEVKPKDLHSSVPTAILPGSILRMTQDNFSREVVVRERNAGPSASLRMTNFVSYRLRVDKDDPLRV
ncbi:hypothetical protein, partial [Terriglobus sp. ADX1]|uniref:hypothetical protein n=1 Tax=Terriglobus sp. ADX1 TaxID=2794063 RepID=UPI002FE587E5